MSLSRACGAVFAKTVGFALTFEPLRPLMSALRAVISGLKSTGSALLKLTYIGLFILIDSPRHALRRAALFGLLAGLNFWVFDLDSENVAFGLLLVVLALAETLVILWTLGKLTDGLEWFRASIQDADDEVMAQLAKDDLDGLSSYSTELIADIRTLSAP